MQATQTTLGATLLALVLVPAACERGAGLGSPAPNVPGTERGSRLVVTPPAPGPPGPASVRVYVKMIVCKKYGTLAHLVGNRDCVENHMTYDPNNHWWKNPLVVYDEVPGSACPDLTAQSDADPIAGQGQSSNVAIALTLVPHVDLALKTFPKCEAVRGTITVTIAAVSDYYDGAWTQMARLDDKVLVFAFDTRDPSKPLEEVGRDIRTVPAFAFERYTRERQKWEPKSDWPMQPERGDWRITVYGKEAHLAVTAYRYGPQATARSSN
jgi:hypothetical protein